MKITVLIIAFSLGLGGLNNLFVEKGSIDIESFIQSTYTFGYSKYDLVGLSGQTVISKTTTEESGIILFQKDAVVLNSNSSKKIFKIEKYIKQRDGYQINTLDQSGQRCIINVINRQGIDFVVFHYVNKSTMNMYHVSSGFNLNMGIYN